MAKKTKERKMPKAKKASYCLFILIRAKVVDGVIYLSLNEGKWIEAEGAEAQFRCIVGGQLQDAIEKAIELCECLY
jgi:hypothetical protein